MSGHAKGLQTIRQSASPSDRGPKADSKYDGATVMRSNALAPQLSPACPPFLRWAGSKRKLLPKLRAFWKSDEHQRYVEPFAGSACLFFAISPKKALLGDLNPELISTYIEVKYRLNAVLAELKRYKPYDKAEYLRLRSLNPAILDRSIRAARFIYLNRFCFNGIYRTNLHGHFNVPYSGNGCGELPSDELFKECSQRLKSTRFLNKDFEAVLDEARPGDLVYMDPPYAVRSKRIFREYHPDAFSPADVERLRKWMLDLHAEKIDFVVSYAASEEAEYLRQGFKYTSVDVRRNIAGFSAHRALSTEVLITNTGVCK